jgi:putative transposase
MSIVRQWLRELATARPRFGYERLHILLPRQGWRVGRSRVHRIFMLRGLQVRMRPRRRKRIRLHRGPVPVTTNGGQYWAMDSVHDQLASGRKYRVLAVIDKWHRQCVALQADLALTGHSVVDAMDAISRERELPYAMTVDHGAEFASKCSTSGATCAA